ncbi:MAG: hypothetical protein WC460_06495 [Patescibacteria group bacterium]
MKKISNLEFHEVQYKDLPQIITGLANDQLVKISFYDRSDSGHPYEGKNSRSEISLVSEIRNELCSLESIERERIGKIFICHNDEQGITTFVKILTPEETAAYYADVKAEIEAREMEAVGIYLKGEDPDAIIELAERIKEFRIQKAKK